MSGRRRLKSFILRLSIFIILLRSLMVFLLPLLLQNPIGIRLVSDSLHHYHVAFALIPLGMVIYKKWPNHFSTYAALCLALILEEYLVIVYELGVSVPYNYLSPADNLLVYSLAAAGVLLAYREGDP